MNLIFKYKCNELCGDTMQKFIFRRFDSSEIIFEGQYKSASHALKQAISDNVNLDYIDLSGQILRHINLDDCCFDNANFKDADLRGANMSEAHFKSCDFSNALLQDACLNETIIKKCAFLHTRFGDTDCAGTDFSDCVFSGLSCFSMKFSECFSLDGCLYFDETIRSHHMTRAPIVIQGLEKATAILDDVTIMGQDVLVHEKLYTQYLQQQRSNDEKYAYLILALIFESGRLSHKTAF